MRLPMIVSVSISYIVGCLFMWGEIAFRNWGTDTGALLAAFLLGAPLIGLFVFIPAFAAVVVIFDVFFPVDKR